jgi:hypothetical protein
MAAKRHKKHKKKISGLVNSMCYSENSCRLGDIMSKLYAYLYKLYSRYFRPDPLQELIKRRRR